MKRPSVDKLTELAAEHKGNISDIAKAVGVSRSTVYRWKTEVKAFEQALYDERESLIDRVENKLRDEMDSGNITAIIFFLKTQAKHRGYSERQEITGADGSEFVLKVYGNDAAKDI